MINDRSVEDLSYKAEQNTKKQRIKAQSSNDDSLLSFSNVSLSYGKQEVVSDVNFSVNKGDYFCLLGGNGSGKTTLVRAAMGLISAGAGKIEFHIPRERVSYLPQISTAMDDFPATVREVVMSGRQHPGVGIPFYKAEDKSATKRAIELFSIGDLENRRLNQLSGGQRQRVLLARAMCKEPTLLILDEPANALDANIMQQLYETLYNLNQKHGVAIFMISHDKQEIVKYANKIAVLEEHHLAFCGAVDEWMKYDR